MPLTTEDKLEIMELTSRYNFAIDRRLAEEWAEVFTEDGQLFSNGELRAAGTADLQQYMRAAAKTPMKIRHWTANPIIEEGKAPGSATLRMYVMAWDITGGDGMTPYVMGEYNDDLVREKGKWKFKARRVTPCAGKIPARPAK
jgi:hypothetical protein